MTAQYPELTLLKEIDTRLTEQLNLLDASAAIDDWFFHFPWPAWLKGADGVMIAINPAYTEHYGIELKDYVGTKDAPWDRSTRAAFGANDKEVAGTGRPGVYSERIYNNKTGESENLLVCKFPVYQGPDLIGVGGFCIYIPT